MGPDYYETALEAIRALFSDTGATPAETKENLQTLILEIQDMIAALPKDNE